MSRKNSETTVIVPHLIIMTENSFYMKAKYSFSSTDEVNSYCIGRL